MQAQSDANAACRWTKSRFLFVKQIQTNSYLLAHSVPCILDPSSLKGRAVNRVPDRGFGISIHPDKSEHTCCVYVALLEA